MWRPACIGSLKPPPRTLGRRPTPVSLSALPKTRNTRQDRGCLWACLEHELPNCRELGGDSNAMFHCTASGRGNPPVFWALSNIQISSGRLGASGRRIGRHPRTTRHRTKTAGALPGRTPNDGSSSKFFPGPPSPIPPQTMSTWTVSAPPTRLLQRTLAALARL